MMTSLFSFDFRNILLTAIDKYELTNKGYKTYGYLEDNIRPVVESIINETNKDNYRLVKIGSIDTMSEEVNIWFVGYYDWSKADNYRRNGFYVGKSICISEVPNKDRQYTEKLNLIFDGSTIVDIRDDKLIDSVCSYWGVLMEYLFEETDLKNLTVKFTNSYLFGIEMKNYLTYIELVSMYHLYYIITSYSVNSVCKFLKQNISEKDLETRFKHRMRTEMSLHDFAEKIDSYKK